MRQLTLLIPIRRWSSCEKREKLLRCQPRPSSDDGSCSPLCCRVERWCHVTCGAAAGVRIARQHTGSMLSELVPMPRDRIDQPGAGKQPVRQCHTEIAIPFLQAHDTVRNYD